MNKLILMAVFAALACLPITTMKAHAQAHDEHQHEEDHSHEDKHDDHGEESSHDDHAHGNEDEHGHAENEEGQTEITSDAAHKAGIVIEKASSARIGEAVSLTGRIVINQNTKANVRARFAGIVRSVAANLGDVVEKGQVLAVVEANESLQDYKVTAPISGVVLERHTNIGDVANGEPLFVIVDLSEVWAKFHVFPKDADAVKTGQNVRVHTLDEAKANQAVIDMLFPTADALSQTLVAIAPLENKQGLWRPGMTVEGDVVISEKSVPVAVRVSALQTMEEQTVIFIQDGNTYEKVAVETGISDGQYIQIKSGISAGQKYVSEGSFIIKADILKAGAEHVH